MAAAKKGPRSLRNVRNAEGHPMTHDDVMMPLARARAALWMLEATAGRHAALPLPEEHSGWLRDLFVSTIFDSIVEAEQEYARKYAASAATPAAEAA
jgi:hypothetical protein